jgi:hypothetical protein
MKKSFSNYFLYLIIACCSVVITSCKKDKQPSEPVITNYAKIGLYQKSSIDNGTTYKRVIMPVKIGTSTTLYGSIFDTGSTGLTIDANGLIPANMITSNGIIFAGDSTLVNGITITSTQAVIAFGGGASSETREYGHLAYTNVSMGDSNGNVTVTRMPIFLYYKIEDVTNNTTLPAHSADVFGVGPGNSYASSTIASPLSYFKLSSGVTNGFRLALFSAPFTSTLTFAPGLLTIGLTPTDLNSSSFIMHNLDYYSVGGYSPNIRASITYNGKTVNNAFLLFDTGDPAITYLSDPTASANVITLPAGTPVSLTTNNGFNYQYTTATNSNETQVIKLSYSNDIRSIFDIDFFVKNEYLLDYQNHRIGLKNN